MQRSTFWMMMLGIALIAVSAGTYSVHRRRLAQERALALAAVESACQQARVNEAQRDPAIETYAAAQDAQRQGQAADALQDWGSARDSYQRASASCRQAIPLAQRRLADEANALAVKARVEANEAQAQRFERYRVAQSTYDAGMEALSNGDSRAAREKFQESAETFRVATREVPAAEARSEAQSAHVAALAAGVSAQDPRLTRAVEQLRVGEQAYEEKEFPGATEALVSAKALLEEATRSLIDAAPPGMVPFRAAGDERGGAANLITFIVGSTKEQVDAAMELCRRAVKNCQRAWYSDEENREVKIEPFAIDQYEITVAQFARFADTTGYRTTAEELGYVYAPEEDGWARVLGYSWRHPYGAESNHGDFLDHPVSAMSGLDAEAYCQWAEARLPTAEEWEFAAGGPDHRTFPWGAEWHPAKVHWQDGKTQRTRPVGTFLAGSTVNGVHDLSGNVWEWTATSRGQDRILKGGSWCEDNPANLRVAAQRFEAPNAPHIDDGFRCARSLAPTDKAD